MNFKDFRKGLSDILGDNEWNKFVVDLECLWIMDKITKVISGSSWGDSQYGPWQELGRFEIVKKGGEIEYIKYNGSIFYEQGEYLIKVSNITDREVRFCCDNLEMATRDDGIEVIKDRKTGNAELRYCEERGELPDNLKPILFIAKNSNCKIEFYLKGGIKVEALPNDTYDTLKNKCRKLLKK